MAEADGAQAQEIQRQCLDMIHRKRKAQISRRRRFFSPARLPSALRSARIRNDLPRQVAMACM